MSSAEQAVRARALALLTGDGDLTRLVHGIFDGVPPRASAPYVAVGAAEGSDWGTKDRPGREVRVTLALVGEGAAERDEAAARIDAIAATLRGPAEGWTIAAARTVRVRFGFAKGGGWRRETVVRCRCLMG